MEQYILQKMQQLRVEIMNIYEIKELINSKSVYLPIYGHIFDRESLLELLKELEQSNVYILGGDVLQKCKNGEFEYTYDSWYSDPKEVNQKESLNRAIEYVKSYPLKDNIYFTLVWEKYAKDGK